VLRAEPGRADGPPFRLHLAEDLGELRLARPVGGAAAGLDIARVIGLPGEIGEERGGALPVLGGVLAVGGVEEVDVVPPRVIARFTSWRKRRSSLVKATGSSWTARRFTASLTVRRRSSRARAPRLSQPSRT